MLLLRGYSTGGQILVRGIIVVVVVVLRTSGSGADEHGRDDASPSAGPARLAPFAILAIMVVALALVPVVTQYTVRTANVYDIFQNFASYGLVALALGITIIAGEFDLSVSSMYLLGGMVAVLTGRRLAPPRHRRRPRHRDPRRPRPGRPDRPASG